MRGNRYGLLFAALALVLAAASPARAGDYKDSDVQRLQDVYNTNGPGYLPSSWTDINDPSTWSDIFWTGVATDREVEELRIFNQDLADAVNLSYLQSLKVLDITYNAAVTSLDLTGSNALEELSASSTGLTNALGDFRHLTNLSVLEL